MDIDDPRLEAKRKEIEERIEKLDSLTLAVIKAHHVLEDLIDEFLGLSFSYYKSVGRLMYANKIRQCRAMSFNESTNRCWHILGCLNGLRNALAHDRDGEGVEEQMRTFKSAYLDSLTEQQRKGMDEQPDETIVVSASGYLAAFFYVLTEEAKARRIAIDTHWKPTLTF